LEQNKELYLFKNITWVYGQVTDPENGTKYFKAVPYQANKTNDKYIDIFSRNIRKRSFFTATTSLSKLAVKAFNEDYSCDNARAIDNFGLYDLFIAPLKDKSQFIKAAGSKIDKYNYDLTPMDIKFLQFIAHDIETGQTLITKQKSDEKSIEERVDMSMDF